MKLFLGLAIALLTLPAFANEGGPQNCNANPQQPFCGGQGGNGGEGGSITIGDVTVAPVQTNTQSNTQSNSQTNSQTVGDTNVTASPTLNATNSATGGAGGNSSQNVTVNNSGGPGITIDNRNRRQAPTIIGASVPVAFGSCGLGWTATASAPGFGASFGKAHADGNCQALMAATALSNMGLQTVAIARMCLEKNLAKAFEREYPGVCESELPISEYLETPAIPEQQVNPIALQASYKPQHCKGSSSYSQDREWRLRGKC